MNCIGSLFDLITVVTNLLYMKECNNNTRLAFDLTTLFLSLQKLKLYCIEIHYVRYSELFAVSCWNLGWWYKLGNICLCGSFMSGEVSLYKVNKCQRAWLILVVVVSAYWFVLCILLSIILLLSILCILLLLVWSH